MHEIAETEDADQMDRITARETADGIQQWLDKNSETIKSKLRFSKGLNGYLIKLDQMGLPYRDITLVFKEGAGYGVYGRHPEDTKQKYIVLKILPDVSEISHVSHFFKSIGRSAFIHEFIHYIEDTNYNYDNRNINQDEKSLNVDGGWQKYINSPEEYNAYYQQAVAKLEDYLDELELDAENSKYAVYKKKFQNMTAPEFVKWFINPTNGFIVSAYIDFLNTKFKRKLEKRLARFFTENLKTLYEKINEAARIGTGVRKDEIPEKYRKYPLINRGTTSAILEFNPDVVLMLTKDGIKKDWLVNELGIADMIDAYDSRHPKLGVMTVYVLKMPKLYPLSKENKRLAGDLVELLRLMNKKAYEKNKSQGIGDLRKMSKKQIDTIYKENIINAFFEYFDEYEQSNEKEHTLIQLIRFLANYSVDQYEWDLRQGNFMQTKTGELVVLDPIIDKEILDIFKHGYNPNKVEYVNADYV